MITLRRYQAGEIILQENHLGETAYVITQGQVEVSKELQNQRVHLAYLRAGETFGEMSMIDEKPRSATVTAVTETMVSEIRRDDFFNSFQTDPTIALQLLKVLFERLREADARILELQKADPHDALVPEVLDVVPASGQPTITLEGVTPRAAAALPVTPFQIAQFPFRIG
jgi:CRP/FNR family cyclic AMP-dependent transcriptional regulator